MFTRRGRPSDDIAVDIPAPGLLLLLAIARPPVTPFGGCVVIASFERDGRTES